MKRLRKILQCEHHFTVAYSPWANGLSGNAVKQVVHSSEACLVKPKRILPIGDICYLWHSQPLITLFSSARQMSPYKTHFGTKPTTPLDTILQRSGDYIDDLNLVQLTPERFQELGKQMDAILDKHAETVGSKMKCRRESQRATYNRKFEETKLGSQHMKETWLAADVG